MGGRGIDMPIGDVGNDTIVDNVRISVADLSVVAQMAFRLRSAYTGET